MTDQPYNDEYDYGSLTADLLGNQEEAGGKQGGGTGEGGEDAASEAGLLSLYPEQSRAA